MNLEKINVNNKEHCVQLCPKGCPNTDSSTALPPPQHWYINAILALKSLVANAIFC